MQYGSEEHIIDNVLTITCYELEYTYRGEKGSGFWFPCNSKGEVDPNMNPAALENYRKCKDGTYLVDCAGVIRRHQYIHLCECGSQQPPEAIYDARGIYVTKACDSCRSSKVAGYRSDIFTDANYWSDEPVEPYDY